MFVQKIVQAIFLAIAVVAPLNAQAQTTTATEPLIGEVSINAISVHPYADAIVAEAFTIWSSSGWRVISNTSDILNEGKAVSGVFAKSGVELTRAKAIVHVPAQQLFDFLITPTGYQLIDPLSDPADFSKPPLAEYPTLFWRGIGNTDKKKLQIERTETIIPGIRTREFVVLNSIDQLSRIFVSKSVQNAADPGCSEYGPASCRNATEFPVRALNTFAVDVQPLASNKSQSVVRLINYADLRGPEVTPALQNQINSVFLPQMIERFRTAFP